MRASQFVGLAYGESEVINLNPNAPDGAVAVLRRDLNGDRHLEILEPVGSTAVRVKLRETEVGNLVEVLKRFPCQLKATFEETQRA